MKKWYEKMVYFASPMLSLSVSSDICNGKIKLLCYLRFIFNNNLSLEEGV